jgi:hypothetical protein
LNGTELVTVDDMIATAEYSRRIARNDFATQIHKFIQSLAADGRTQREIDLLAAISVYVEQEARAI